MSTPIMLAPMAEISHRALRELIEGFKPKTGGIPGSHGADEYFTEMISAGALLGGGPWEAWYADNGPCPEKLIFQLVGGDEGQLCRAAALLDKQECLGIDINMGCSAPAITRTGAGVRWMADIDKAAALIRRVRPQVSRRLSVKLRTGFDDNFEYLVNFCRHLEEEGVDLITLHPRTAKEKFKRRARWGQISALRKELKIPVAGNGDICSAAEILSRARECDGVMVGRLAVRRPWIFAEAKSAPEMVPEMVPGTISEGTVSEGTVSEGTVSEGTVSEGTVSEGAFLEETGLRFLELLSLYQPPEFHVSRAMRFFHYFCDNLKWGNYVKNLLNRESDFSGIERAWRGYFSSTGPDALSRAEP